MYNFSKLECYRWILWVAVTASCINAVVLFRTAPEGLPLVLLNAITPVFLFFFFRKDSANRLGLFLLCSPLVFIGETLYIIITGIVLPLQLALNMLVVIFTCCLTLFAISGDQFTGQLKKYLDLYLIPLMISIIAALMVIYHKYPFPIVPYLLVLVALSALYIIMVRQIRSNERKITEQHQSIANNHIMMRGFIHDLGNSIAAASGWSSMAIKAATEEKRKINGEKANDAFKHVIDHVKTVTLLLNDQKNVVSLVQISPAAFCEALLSYLQKSYVGEIILGKDAVAVTPGVLDFRMPATFTGKHLYADTEGFGRVLHNMVINAQKAGATGIAIIIEEVPDPASLRIRILDNGKGIAEETTARLFKERIASDNGSGVGLLGVRMIVRCHNATIEIAEPNSNGTGQTEFVISNLLYCK
jgi:signal transduction histidine kinase